MTSPVRLGQKPSNAHLRIHAMRMALSGTEVRYGYDGLNSDAALIFKNTGKTVPAWVAGYVSGGYAWTTQDWNLFNGVSGPATLCVTIATQADVNAGDVLDVENYDATPDQTEAWITMRKAAGLYRPTIYCSADNVPAVRVGTGQYILNEDYDLWVADWTGSPHQFVCADGKKCAATQYASGTWCDYDAAYDSAWPHRKPPVKKPAPTPPPPKPAPIPTPTIAALLGDVMQLNHGANAETPVSVPTGAAGLRLQAATRAKIIVDFPGVSAAPKTYDLRYGDGPTDIPLPVNDKGKVVYGAKLVRADGDNDDNVSVASY